MVVVVLSFINELAHWFMLSLKIYGPSRVKFILLRANNQFSAFDIHKDRRQVFSYEANV